MSKRLESITPNKWSHGKLSAAKPCLKTDLDIHFTHAANVCNYRSKLFKSGLEVELFLIVMTGQITDF